VSGPATTNFVDATKRSTWKRTAGGRLAAEGRLIAASIRNDNFDATATTPQNPAHH